jgi:AcrR family transcriptional regulator
MSDYSGAGDVDVSLALLWGLREQPTRGRKPSISVDDIVAKAVEIADSEGLEAVSMRRISTDLGVGTMSLYRHVPGKSELLDLMIDHVQGLANRPPHAGDGWRQQVENCGRGVYRLYLDHPWLLQVDLSRPLLGPNSLAGLENFLGALSEVPLDPREKMMLVVSVDALVSGLARLEVQQSRAEERTGITDDEFWAAQTPVLTSVLESGRYPIMGALPTEAFGGTWAEQLDFALTALLDGYEQQIAARTDT